ncbi:MAG: DNA repair protein RecO [Deltaproteobacteria bacterium]|nr:DNA repair protein RecO [Deltaproteobacteria bacterium]
MKRGLYKARAVILNSIDYGESDRILTFHTLEHGKLTGIAKGARRSRKRFVGNIEPASEILLVFFHGGKSDMVRVEDASLIDAYSALKSDIERLSQACYLLELVAEMTREGQRLPGVFSLLTGFLKMLETEDGETVLRFFEIRLLSMLGYLPHLDCCVVCRRPFAAEERLFFSSEKGGTVCARCAVSAGSVAGISAGTARLLSMAAKFDTDKLGRLKPGAAFLEESEGILYDFIKFQIGKELKTKKFMAKLKNASL